MKCFVGEGPFWKRVASPTPPPPKTFILFCLRPNDNGNGTECSVPLPLLFFEVSPDCRRIAAGLPREAFEAAMRTLAELLAKPPSDLLV